MNFDILITDVFVWSYCGGIVLLLGIATERLSRKARSVRGKLLRWTRKLRALGGDEAEPERGFVRAFEEFNAGMEADFGTPWQEFVETLILPDPASDEPIRNSHEVSRYLNGTTIIAPEVSLGFYRSMPNLLTGLGILGTFMGLAAGVGAARVGLSSGDPTEITASLQQLLSGASLAFLTSITGIGSSILFVLVERRATWFLNLAVDDWVKAIESCLQRVTTEGVALLQLGELRNTTKQLTRFNTELIFSLEQALEEKIAGRLSPHLERLVEVVEGLRTDRSSDAGKMIERALGEFTEAMQESTGSQFEEMASIVADLNRTLKASSDRMAESQRDIQVALESVINTVRTSMNDGASAMTETLQQSLATVTRELSAASSQVADQLTTSSISAATQLQDAIGSVTDTLAKTGVEAASQITGSLDGLQGAAETLRQSTQQNQRVLKDMTTFVEQLNRLRGTIESAQQSIIEVSQPIGRAAHDIGASSDRVADTVVRAGTLVDRIDGVVGRLEENQKSVAQAWSRYQERFEGIDDSLGTVFRQIDEGLAGYCEQVKRFANELDRTTSKTVQDLAGATHELGQSIEDLTGHLAGRA
jgi:ABC-type transporter Mla subunit MlaD